MQEVGATLHSTTSTSLSLFFNTLHDTELELSQLLTEGMINYRLFCIKFRIRRREFKSCRYLLGRLHVIFTAPTC